MRRTLVRAATAWCLCILVCAGCRPAGQVGPRPGGKYVQAMAGEPEGLNPLIHADEGSSTVCSLLFNSLARLDERLAWVPDLAESWEPLKGQAGWTFRLRKDVVWHDGRQFTADDVVFTFAALAHPGLPAFLRGPFRGRPVSVTKIDAWTVEMVVEGAGRVFPEETLVPIVPRHILSGVPYARWGEHSSAARPTGTGPYVLKEWIEGERIVLACNHRYHHGRPFIAEVEFRFYPGPEEAAAALFEGQVDGAEIPPGMVARVRRLRKKLAVHPVESTGCVFLCFNLGSRGEQDVPFFKETTVRQAIACAIDKKKVLEEAAGDGGMPRWSVFCQSSWMTEGLVDPYPYSPAKAKRMLASAGWEDVDRDGVLERGGVKFKVSCFVPKFRPEEVKAARAIARYLSRVGIAVDVVPDDYREFIWSRLAPPFDFDMVIMEWPPTFDLDLYELFHSTAVPRQSASLKIEGGANFVGYRSARADSLLEAARSEMDQAASREITRKIAQVVADELPYCFLWSPARYYGVRRRVVGVKPSAAGLYWNISEWYIAD